MLIGFVKESNFPMVFGESFIKFVLFIQSLGFPHTSLTFVKTDHGSRPQLKYLDGSICPQDAKTKMSSQIEFFCDPTAGKVKNILYMNIRISIENSVFI